MVASKISDERNYTCVARNEAGIDSKEFSVHLTGKIIVLPRI